MVYVNCFKYLRHGFQKYLLLGNTLSSAALMSIGDLIEQHNEIKRSKHSSVDWMRNLRMTIVGVGMGVINHYYYGWIDRVISKSTVKHCFMKVVADQMVASPICITFLFYCDGALLGHELNEIHTEMREKFVTIYTADWCFWPPLQYINFRYVHRDYRVVFLNTVQMFYNIFLSHIKYKKKPIDGDDNDAESETQHTIPTRFVSLEGYMEGYHHHRS